MGKLKRQDLELELENTVVQVCWIDACHLSDEHTKGELLKEDELEYITVGVVVADEEDKLIIAGSMTRDGDCLNFRDSLILPKRYIKEIKQLEVKI